MRGREGMEETFELHRCSGAVSRAWGKAGEGRVVGELGGVGQGAVELVLRDGSKKVLKVGELGEGDVKFLEVELTKEDRRAVFGGVTGDT